LPKPPNPSLKILNTIYLDATTRPENID
jgi:hypothetical protein